jgi:manganese transport protein
VTAALAGASIFAGLSKEPLDLKDNHSRLGAAITLGGALILILLVNEPFKGLIWSQIALSIQLPWTIVGMIFLTSAAKVMGAHRNPPQTKVVLWTIAAIVAVLNVMLLFQML